MTHAVLESPIRTRLYPGEKIIIGETTGKRTFAQANLLFTGHLDPDFAEWGTGKKDVETGPTPVEIYEARDKTFGQMFGSASNPYSFVLTQDQAISFCKAHRNKLSLGDCATSFLFKVENKSGQSDLFVASVFVVMSQLEAYISHFEHALTWSHCQIVIPGLMRSTF